MEIWAEIGFHIDRVSWVPVTTTIGKTMTLAIQKEATEGEGHLTLREEALILPKETCPEVGSTSLIFLQGATEATSVKEHAPRVEIEPIWAASGAPLAAAAAGFIPVVDLDRCLRDARCT